MASERAWSFGMPRMAGSWASSWAVNPATAAEAQVDEVAAVGDRPVDGLGDGEVAGAVGVLAEDAVAAEGGPRRQAAYARGRGALRRDDAADVGAVALAVVAEVVGVLVLHR